MSNINHKLLKNVCCVCCKLKIILLEYQTLDEFAHDYKGSWMKKIIVFFMCIFSLSCFADCAKAPDPSDPNFCSAFKPIAVCHCMADGHLPEKLCPNGKVIHQRMIAAFGTQDAACLWQERNGSEKKATYQECMDDWNCYMKGGVDSNGGLCNATGNPCE